jgi:hypothetical protein
MAVGAIQQVSREARERLCEWMRDARAPALSLPPDVLAAARAEALILLLADRLGSRRCPASCATRQSSRRCARANCAQCSTR